MGPQKYQCRLKSVDSLPESGFSLMEVLLALTVFAIGGLAAAGMVTSAYRSIDHAREKTAITFLASEILEEFMGRPPEYCEDTDNDGVAGLSDTGEQADGEKIVDGYKVSWNCAPEEPVAGTVIMRVIVGQAIPVPHGAKPSSVEFSAMRIIP